jgi:hypothetical protein
MLVTSQFVLINLPKTGSSFVRKVIKAIYAKRRWRWGADRFLKELMLPPLYAIGRGPDQHGTLQQVPQAYRHLPVVSVVRNPYDKLLSMFEFRWWVAHPFLPLADVKQMFPHFPDLKLDEFIEMIDAHSARTLGGANPHSLGRQTIQFVRFFFNEPERVLSRLSDDYVESGAFRQDMGPVMLLRQERLNAELADFLAGFGYSEDELEICRRHPRVNPTARGVIARDLLWTSEAYEYVAVKERYLLKMIENLGIVYEPPAAAKHGHANSDHSSGPQRSARAIRGNICCTCRR